VKHIYLIILAAVILLIAGCGPSPEEIATMTAAAWTPTPLPTATPTPIPFDISVNIVDQDGNPIPKASIVFPESGDDTPVTADDSGQASWNNLPGDSGNLGVTAQGYLPSEESLSLERGLNEVTVTLERDAYGLLPADACAAGETLAYAEDFQDGVADGWPEIQFNAPGWAITSDPNDESDLVISASYSESTGGSPMNSRLEGYAYENAVWRIRYLIVGRIVEPNWFSFNWLQAPEPVFVNDTEVFDSRYQLPLNQNNFHMRRLQQPILNIQVASGRYPKEGVWHYVEMATYQGYTEVWVDGVLNMKYQDPQPLPAGGPGLELWLGDETATVYFDDISLCELSAAFAPIPTPTPEPAE
jgi:hypothetical protein